MKKRICVLVLSALMMLLLFVGCSGRHTSAASLNTPSLTFDSPTLQYLGMARDDVIEALSASGESWNYAAGGGKFDAASAELPNFTLERSTTASAGGEDYTLFLRINQNEAWETAFERVATGDEDTAHTAVRTVWDTLVKDFGEPEEQKRSTTVRNALTDGFDAGRAYNEWWVVEEHYEMSADPGRDVVLLCHLTATLADVGMTIQVEYVLYQSDMLYEMGGLLRFA